MVPTICVEHASACITTGGKLAFDLALSGPAGESSERMVWSPESPINARRFAERLAVLGASTQWILAERPSPEQVAARLVGAEITIAADDDWAPAPDGPAVFVEAAQQIRNGLSVVLVHGLWQPSPGPAWWCQCPRSNCGSPGKHPVASRWQHTELSIADVKRAAERSQRFPPNLGLNHSRSLTWALDADTPEAVAWVENQSWATDLTAAIRTGKGKQWIFRQDESRVMIPTIPQPLFRLAGVSGLEVRGLGSQSVLPPSKHHYGMEREWIDDGPIKLPPPDLLALVWTVHGGQPSVEDAAKNVNRSVGGTVSGKGVGTMLNRLAAAQNGGRNNIAYATAQFIRDALDCGVIPEDADTVAAVRADYVDAAAACGLMADEPDAVTGLWDRIVVGGERPGVSR